MAHRPFRIVGPQPLQALVHRRHRIPRQIRVHVVHPVHVGGLLDRRPLRLPGAHAVRRAAVLLAPLRPFGQAQHVLPPGLALAIRDGRCGDHLGDARSHVTDFHVALGGQQAMVCGGLDLTAGRELDLEQHLAAGLHDLSHLVGPDLPVVPHRHDLRHSEPSCRRQQHPPTIGQDHPRRCVDALVKGIFRAALVVVPEALSIRTIDAVRDAAVDELVLE